MPESFVTNAGKSLVAIVEKIYIYEDKRFADIVLKYLIEGGKLTADKAFLKAIENRFDKQFEGEIMTLAESFEEKGRIDGLMKGRVEGRVEGRVAAQQQMVLRLLQEGCSTSFIQKVTGLEVRVIEDIADSASGQTH